MIVWNFESLKLQKSMRKDALLIKRNHHVYSILDSQNFSILRTQIVKMAPLIEDAFLKFKSLTL